MPTVESAAIACSRQPAVRPWNSIDTRKFSSTVYHGNSVLSWNTNATSLGSGPRTAASPTVTPPDDGVSKPPMMFSSVLFPQPDGPSKLTNSPRLTSSETSSSATASGAPLVPAKSLRHAIDADRRRHAGGTQSLTGTNCELYIVFGSGTESARPRSLSDAATAATAAGSQAPLVDIDDISLS